MMKDIKNVNCWMVYLMPFDNSDRKDYEKVNKFQQDCISEKIFGMGWSMDLFDYGTPISGEKAEEYLKKYDAEAAGTGKVSSSAVKSYVKIKKGDYIIMRLKNSHYYVGKVSSDGAVYMYRENDIVYSRFSWGGRVDKWIEYSNDCEVPSDIEGRFSQRQHATIQRIAADRMKMLVISMYENGEKEEDRIYNIPKIVVNKENFVRSLSYKELEDAVAFFIHERHAGEGYRLLPSSCKNSRQKYEFTYVAGNRKPITCQVKNQSEVETEQYTEENTYEYIYIFSGLWNDDRVEELRKVYEEYKHIYIISPSELFQTLKDSNIINSRYYELEI